MTPAAAAGAVGLPGGCLNSPEGGNNEREVVRMDSESRRRQLRQLLQEAKETVTGTELANHFQVSRQVIVQDIAILRAGGEKIIATPQGYLLPHLLSRDKATRTFACCHQYEDIEAELQTMLDMGGKVIDVVVEHPLYGELRGLLMLKEKSDLTEFMENLRVTKAQPLLALTGGVHLHTVEAASEDNLDRIAAALEKAGFLLTKD